RREREQQEERLAVHRLQEQRHRTNREVEDGAARSAGAEAGVGEAVEEDERAERRGERDRDPCQDVLTAENVPQHPQRGRVKGREGGRGVVVAMLGDLEEEAAVPAGPEVGEPAELVHDRPVPDTRAWVPIRLEPEERERGGDPDRDPAPEEELGDREPCLGYPQLYPAGAALANSLTCAHDRRDHTSVTDRYFTPDEASELLPAVRRLVERMVRHRRALTRALERQERLRGAVTSNGGGIPVREPADAQAEVETAASEVARCIDGIHELGVLVKDVDRGLVDF